MAWPRVLAHVPMTSCLAYVPMIPCLAHDPSSCRHPCGSGSGGPAREATKAERARGEARRADFLAGFKNDNCTVHCLNFMASF